MTARPTTAPSVATSAHGRMMPTGNTAWGGAVDLTHLPEMKVLVACEFSGVVRDAFKARGHDAMSCDLEPTESPGKHYQGDVLDILDDDWDLLIAHPPCTFLSNSSSKHLYIGMKKTEGRSLDRWEKMKAAALFFRLLLRAPIKRKAIENPIIHYHAADLIGRRQDQIIQPWEHGHKEMKATCLWLENLPLLKETNNVGPPPKDPEERKAWARVHRMPPGPERQKERSRTLSGIAEAFAEQWG